MPQPNILLITTDQQRYDTIAAAGYPYMITPNLDALASEGCIFQSCYSPNPVCLPARHNILTGLSAKYHTFDTNYFDDSHYMPYALPTFPQILSDHGYDTAAIGKMHFQPYRRHNGFARLELMDEIPRFQEDDDYAMYLKNNGYSSLQSIHGVRHLLYMQPQQSLVSEKDHGSAWVADRSIAYLRERSLNRPFLLWAGFIEPHPPFDVPHSYAHLYDDIDLPEPTVTQTPLSALAEENKAIADNPTKETVHRIRQLYAAAITFTDHQIGRILDELKKQNLADNTLVIFTSDHGEMLGDLGTWQKFLPNRPSSCVPMIMRWPGHIQAGSHEFRFADLNDLMPTILDAADLEYPDHSIQLPGGSLLHMNTKDRRYQYIEHEHGNKRWCSIQDSRYRYTYYYGGGHEEFFDLLNDPKETANLMETGSMKQNNDCLRLKAECIRMEEKWGLPGYVIDHQFIKLEPYIPQFYLECNPPMFPENLQKKLPMKPLEEELEKALADEPGVDLAHLNTGYFTERGVLKEPLLKEIQKRRRSNS